MSIGATTGAARSTIDATGLLVCPGFIDVHTHYDAQVLWDPTLSPSPLHGVTTVIAGNCGISLAPVDASTAEFLVGLLSRVEAIPLEALEAGLEFSWETFADYLTAVERCAPAANIGFLAGHSALRRSIMGAAASERAASAAELARHAAPAWPTPSRPEPWDSQALPRRPIAMAPVCRRPRLSRRTRSSLRWPGSAAISPGRAWSSSPPRPPMGSSPKSTTS